MTINASFAASGATKITLIELTCEQVADAFAVYNTARGELPFEKKYHLVERDSRFFHNAAESETAGLIGAKMDGALAGIVVVQCVDGWGEAARRGLVQCPDTAMAAQFKAAKLAIVQSLCVLQSAKKKGIGTKLIKEALIWAKAQGAAAVLAQSSEDNECGRGKFKKCGFTETKPFRVQQNGTARSKVLLHKEL